ncbi:MAG: type II CAAX prenyl endopeptidase Rce1 family protein [Bradymonadaceae bacterium]
MPSFDSSSRYRPYLLFGVAFILLITLGSVFQTLLGLHLGLIASQVFVILAVALMYRRLYEPRKEGHWPSLKKTGIPVPLLALSMVAAVAIGFMANVLGSLTVELIPGLREMAQAYQEVIREIMLAETPTHVLLGILAVTVAAPICEEILFRGTILPEQRRHETATKAVILNGVLFSAMHVNPMFFVPLAIIGAYLAHLTLSTGSLWPAILGHFSINAVNGVVLPRIAPEMAMPEEIVLSEVLIALAITGPLAILLWWFVTLKIRDHRGSD